MRITHSNLIDSLKSASVIASSVLTDYPVFNVCDQRLSTQWHSDSASVQTVVIDFGTAVSITTAAVLGHNILDGTVIRIEANTINSWSSPAYSETLTWNEGVILKFFTAQSYRYWRFYIGQGNLEIGRLWLSTYVTIDPSSLLDFTVTYKNSDINIYGIHRQKFSVAGVTWRAFNFNFPPTESTMINTINDLFDEIGIYTSVIFCNFDGGDIGYEMVTPCYVSISSEPQFTHTENMKWEYSLALEEDL